MLVNRWGIFIPWPSLFPMSSGLADGAAMVPLWAAGAGVVVCQTKRGCRVGTVGVLLCVASLILAALRWFSAASKVVSSASNENK